MTFGVKGGLANVPTDDVEQRRDALTLQVLAMIVVALIVCNLLLRFFHPPDVLAIERLVIDWVMYCLATSFALVIVLLRTGRFRPAVVCAFWSPCICLSTTVAILGVEFSTPIFRFYAPLLVIAALLLGRRQLWLGFVVFSFGIGVGWARDHFHLGGHGPRPPHQPPLGHAGQAVVSLLMITVLLQRFAGALRDALQRALQRQAQLQATATNLASANAALVEESTRRRETENALLQAQKVEALGRLCSGVAHDFNNILTVIVNLTSLARSATARDGTKTDFHFAIDSDLLEVEAAAMRGAELTRQLLLFARKQIIEPRAIDATARLEAVKPMLARLAKPDVKLDFTCADPPAFVFIDPIQFDMLLVNLVVNAKDAMPGGGTVKITLSRLDATSARATALGITAGRWLVMDVADTGTGIAPADLSRIFEPFFTTKELGKGTGLGLATVHGIVEQAAGMIDVQTQPGSGTTFTISLPECESHPPAGPRHDDRVPRGARECVLVVDDEPQIRGLIARVLGGLGYHVLSASNLNDAISVMRTSDRAVDLLVTDVVMPGGNGLELSQNLERENPKLKTLFVSGHSDEIIARQGVVREGVQFLTKPFTTDALAIKVRAVLGNQSGRADEKGLLS